MTRRCLTLPALVICFATGCKGDAKPADSATTLLPAIAAPAATATDAPIPPATDAASLASVLKVGPRGIGKLKAGMSPLRAWEVLGLATAAPADSKWKACSYVTLGGLPNGVKVMVEDGTIARIEVHELPVATEEGARVGDTEARIKELYAGRFEVQPHKYTDGHYISVRPVAPTDSAFRLVFETDGNTVRTYRVGRRPSVDYVEGCS
jgi:hypothetical protein